MNWGEIVPSVDSAAPLVGLRPGLHSSLLFVSPIYVSRGYSEAPERLWLRAEVVVRLSQVAGELLEQDVRLLLLDGWRPQSLQARLWHEYRAALALKTGLSGDSLDQETAKYVSPPRGASARVPGHSTGGAIDLTLCDSVGVALDMGGEFDELSERSDPLFYERDGLSPVEMIYRDRRRLLKESMFRSGFVQLVSEWWHFEFGTEYWAKTVDNDRLYSTVDEAAFT